MPQTQFNASGLTADNKDQLKEAGFAVAGVQWVNVNGDNVVVTHDDSFDEAAFIKALQSEDGSVNLSKD